MLDILSTLRTDWALTRISYMSVRQILDVKDHLEQPETTNTAHWEA
jgi:hypothetical protein